MTHAGKYLALRPSLSNFLVPMDFPRLRAGHYETAGISQKHGHRFASTQGGFTFSSRRGPTYICLVVLANLLLFIYVPCTISP